MLSPEAIRGAFRVEKGNDMTTNKQWPTTTPQQTDDPFDYGVEKADVAAPAVPASQAPDTYRTQAPQGYADPASAYPPPGGYGAPTQSMNMNNTVNVSVGGPVIIAPQTQNLPFIVRALWFLCVGWWLSGIAIAVGYLLIATVIGMPLGFALLNKIPQVTTLRPRNQTLGVTTQNGVTTMMYQDQEQYSMWIRAIYFVLVGWWAGLLWLSAAWLLQLPIITMPISILMYDRAPGIITLHRH